jgi:hypothetical protein
LISFSDCRVLDELHPDSIESPRDRQSIHHWPKGNFREALASSLSVACLSQLPHTRPVISSKSISGETRSRLAKPWPVRVALQLETHVGQSTILSNVSRHPEQPIIRDAKLKAAKLSNFAARQSGSQQTYQETSTTKWQKN